MVRFRIDIEADAGDPKALNIMLKTERSDAAEAEDAAAERLLPVLRESLKASFPEGDDSQKAAA